MIPLFIFLLAGVAVYLGAIEAAFSARMRLSLRLSAERSDRPDALEVYLDDPLLLFVPVRLLLGLTTAAAAALLVRATGVEGAHGLTLAFLSVTAFVVVFGLLVPLVIVTLLTYRHAQAGQGAGLPPGEARPGRPDVC